MLPPPSRVIRANRARLRRWAGTLALLVPLAGCAGEPAYYALKPWPGPSYGTAIGTVEVRTPKVAGYLDRDYIVEGVNDYRLTLAGNDAWAEPIADMIGHAVAADLAARLPQARVVAENDAVVPGRNWTVELAIGRFDRDGGAVAVTGLFAIRRHPGEPAAVLQRFEFRRPSPVGSTESLVATLSALTGTLADRLATELNRLAVEPDEAAPATMPGDAPPA